MLGAGGYLGSEVAQKVRAAGQGEVHEIRDAAALEAIDRSITVGAIVNCVGYFGDDRDRLREANCDHAVRAARIAAERDATFVHVSSSAVFDSQKKGRFTEDGLPEPATEYGKSKLDGETAVREMMPEARIARPAKVFGGEDPRQRLHALARHILNRRPIPMPERKELWANFVWRDAAAQVIAGLALAGSAPPITHVSSSMPWSEFVNALAEALQVRPRPMAPLLEPPLGLLAHGLWRLPEPRPRLAARVLEIWDETEFIDTRSLVSSSLFDEGLRDLAYRL